MGGDANTERLCGPDVESEKRAYAFMSKSIADGKPFYVAW